MAKQSKTNQEDPNATSKTSFLLRNGLTKKFKYICLKESRTQTELIDEILTEYIAKYEKKNGEINI